MHYKICSGLHLQAETLLLTSDLLGCSMNRSISVQVGPVGATGLGAMQDGDASLHHNQVLLMLLWHLLRKPVG